VDIVVPGHRVDAILVFCHIRRFDHVTTILEEKSLMFVNLISEIVHLVCDEFSGAANRNMGDSFLMAWRYTPSIAADTELQMKLNDMAIMAAVGIVGSINKSPELAKHRACSNLGDDFHVDVGIGIHTGWAIEGAIGSDYKIDAAYVSPNVKFAEHLQSATLRYGTSILMSDVVVASCNPEMAMICRMVDQVSSKAINRPVRIYCVDLEPHALHTDSKPIIPHIKNRFKWRQIRDAQKAAKWLPVYTIGEEFKTDYDINVMRTGFSNEFFRRFFTAYRNYEAGEWMVARDMLLTCHYEPKYHTPPVDLAEEDWPVDGPTRALLKYMGEYDFEAPYNWQGHRPLEKEAKCGHA